MHKKKNNNKMSSDQLLVETRAVLSQGERRDAAVNFDTYGILQRHPALSLPDHGFLV